MRCRFTARFFGGLVADHVCACEECAGGEEGQGACMRGVGELAGLPILHLVCGPDVGFNLLQPAPHSSNRT